MSERLHKRLTKSYKSPSQVTSLRKAVMRFSPRVIQSPQIYRMPSKRLESPNILKQYQNRIQDSLSGQLTTYNTNNSTVTSENKNLVYYNSPLKLKTEDSDISLSSPSLFPNQNSVISPKREIIVDLPLIRTKNIISKLKREVSNIEALDRTKKEYRINKRTKCRKTVRFDMLHSTKNTASTNNIQNETIINSASDMSINQLHMELSNIKKMLSLIIKKQEVQHLLLNDMLYQKNKLEKYVKTNTIKEKKSKTETL